MLPSPSGARNRAGLPKGAGVLGLAGAGMVLALIWPVGTASSRLCTSKGSSPEAEVNIELLDHVIVILCDTSIYNGHFQIGFKRKTVEKHRFEVFLETFCLYDAPNLGSGKQKMVKLRCDSQAWSKSRGTRRCL